jgi:putative restriction endonuclease
VTEKMQAYVGITDQRWFNFLRNQPHLEEVNFWRPSGQHQFKALRPGELFLFKLHSPNDYIVGGGIFAHYSSLPIDLAWESFNKANGAGSLLELRLQIAKFLHENKNPMYDYFVGCIVLTQPFFLPERNWIPVQDWAPGIQQGKKYDLTIEPGLSIWKRLHLERVPEYETQEIRGGFGEPVLIRPRLGQGSFRILVTDAYERKCAVTNEKTLPALDAAHIKPYAESGEHLVNNGILLRRDLHALFDQGYVTITPSMRLEISRRIKEEFENGRDYYRLHGSLVRTPVNTAERPNRAYLEWHNTHIYKG